jgi:hypothetical protein
MRLIMVSFAHMLFKYEQTTQVSYKATIDLEIETALHQLCVRKRA